MSFLIPDINTFFLLHTHFFSLLVYHVPILSCNPTVYTLCTVSTWGSVYIRQNYRRSCHQCPGYRSSLFLSTRQSRRHRIFLILQSDFFENIFHFPRLYLAIIKSQRKNDILPHIQRWNQIKILKDKSYLLSSKLCQFIIFSRIDIGSINPYFAGIRSVKPSNQMQKCRFSGAGTSYDSCKLASLYL